MNGYRIKAFHVNHNVLCYGYTIGNRPPGKIRCERAKSRIFHRNTGIRLQKGRPSRADGITYTPDMVLGPARKGIKLTYTTDTRPTESILQNAKDSDLFICEGMYGEERKQKKQENISI